ncbi:unnamed protein product [Chironomus riparius]|uniref:Uncharacterized protein n=1 Tax=Chironomus riparius TaxID=315576 RepID=A0A9N9RP05_9DIPT|nr:unnamed protein product [Chironomus riparius]
MKTLFVVIFAIILILKDSNAVNVDCSIQDNVWTPFGHFKECLAYRVVSKEPGQKLEAIESYTDLAELKSFYIYQSPYCFYLPSGIEKIFPNLKTLIIAYSGLMSITQDDLAPFPDLLGLYIDVTKITSIHGDLFINNKNLEELSLQQNQITYVEPDSFKFLTKLISFDFNGNSCHSKKANGRDNVESLMIDIETNCNVKEFVKPEIESSSQVQNILDLYVDEDD